MKKIIIAGAAAALFSAPAFAGPSDTQDFDINATVTPECSMANPTNINLGALSINEDPGENALLLNNPAPSTAQSIYISCNTDATFSVNTLNRRLLTASPVTDTAQFTNEIRYDIKLTPDRTTNFAGLGSYKPRVQAPGPIASGGQPTGEFHANYSLVIGYEAANVNNKRPVAGSYTETVTFTVAAL
ncbi:spore coat protein U domain-containing protein [Erythrobacter sp. R86502]|uniref:spore coat protein U domain-containing protein n=1 Tax=Erythrobacter sp. R86502 TaxID=3093846 RepID=UPI0036D41EE8